MIRALLAPLIIAPLLASARAPSPQASAEPAALVAVIRIETEIDIRSAALVERAVGRALDSGAKVLIVELDTPGGRSDYMLEMVKTIERAHGRGVRTVAYVTEWAKSAGALIALACDEIYLAPTATIGSATPYVVGPEGSPETHEKFIAGFRSTFRARAEATGRPTALVEAMVDPDVEVVEAEVDGERRILSRVDFENEKKARVARARDPGARSDRDVVEIGILKPKGKILDLTARDAVRYGLATAIAPTRDIVISRVSPPGSRVEEFRNNWSESLAGWLTSPGIKTVLFLVGLLALYVEFKTPGFGVAGAIGIACFSLFFFGHLVVGLAEVYEVLLFVAGVGLLALELFVIPGFGVAGIAGILCILASVVLAQMPSFETLGRLQPGTLGESALSAATQTALGSLLAVVGAVAIASVLPRTRFARRLALDSPLVHEGALHGGAADPGLEALLGKEGVAETTLRPAGRARIGDRPVDVVTEGDYLEPGTPVRVIAASGNALVVRKLA